MTVVDLVYFNAGGGHRAAALALQQVLAEQQRPWQVRLLNLTDVLDPTSSFRRFTGMAPEDFYNKRLARGWTLGMRQELRLLQGMIRMAHDTLVRRLQQHWLATEPDLVVSLVPNFNRALCQSLADTLPGVPFVTVLTDLADLPPHFWIEAGQQQHLVCGTPRAAAQARAAGYTEQQITRTSGMILRPEFHRRPALDRAAERAALGLHPTAHTGLVLFGGHGSRQMLAIARALQNVPLILLCGHNEALARELRAQAPTAPHVVLGFTPAVERTMRLAEFFIGKPGPGSLSEAVQMGLPVISFDTAWTMPQERYNLQWLREHGVGTTVRSVRELPACVADLLARLPAFQARLAQMDNRAVFEVADVLARLLADAAAPQAPQAPLAPAASGGGDALGFELEIALRHRHGQRLQAGG